jgi:hypothetical protein
LDKFAYPTTEEVLDSLKTYFIANLKTSQRLVKTVKTGLIDERDELPFLMALPKIEIINTQFCNKLYYVDRTFRLDIVNSEYHVDDLKKSLKLRLNALKQLFQIDTLGWQLRASDGKIQIADFSTGLETFGQSTNVGSIYTQYCSLELTLRSYIQIVNAVIPAELTEVTPTELLDNLHTQIKTAFPIFEENWKDVERPISLLRYPAIGIFFDNASEDKEAQSNTSYDNLTVVIRIYSSLATREIAFLNHLRNVENVKKWIFQRPSLDGSVEKFNLISVDYGIDTVERPYQGKPESVPVFRSDLTIETSLIKFN